MSTQIESSKVKAHRTHWQKLANWVSAFEESMSYDPHEYAINSIQVLSQKVAQLEAKVNELESQTPATGGQ